MTAPAAWAELYDRARTLPLIAAGAAAAAGVGALSMSYPLVAISLVVGLLFAILAFRNLALGLTIFTFLAFFDHIPRFQGSGLTAVKLAGGVLSLVWLLVVMRSGDASPPVLRPQAALILGVSAFCGWVLSSTLWAGDFGAAVSSGFRIVQAAALVLVALTAIRESRHLRWILGAFLGGAVLTAVVGLQGAYSVEGRLAGDFGDPNELAATLVASIVLASFALLSVRPKAIRALLAVTILFFGYALVHTDSQGGLVALAVAFVASIVFAGPVRRLALAVTIAFALAATTYYTVVTQPVELQTITSGGGSGRTDLWRVAVRISEDHPIVGVGAGNLQVVEPDYVLQNVNLPRVDLVAAGKVAHNTYLQVLAEYGAVGLVGFLAVIGGALAIGIRSVRLLAVAGRRDLELLGRGIVVATVSLLAGFTFVSVQYEKQLWLLVGLNAALWTLAVRTAPRHAAAA
jgi:O-antigen ligase